MLMLISRTIRVVHWFIYKREINGNAHRCKCCNKVSFFPTEIHSLKFNFIVHFEMEYILKTFFAYLLLFLLQLKKHLYGGTLGITWLTVNCKLINIYSGSMLGPQSVRLCPCAIPTALLQL